jgi:hypothetical protein
MTTPPVAVHDEMDAAFFENADLWTHVHRRAATAQWRSVPSSWTAAPNLQRRHPRK